MIKLKKNIFYNEPETKRKLSEFILNSNKLSMGEKCKQFEEEFSRYQGRKYSVLFNSGSSANLALIQSLLNLGILKKGDAIGFSALTWPTNVMPLIQLGLNPIPIDISLKNLNVNSENLLETLKEKNIKALFITNLLGFCGDLDKIKEICDRENIILLEDNCESLGSELNGEKLGNFGLASTLSFFVGHHLSTIEGGMVCTDDKDLYETLLMVRAHGWSRNVSADQKEYLKKKYNIDDFYELYTFYTLGYNLRPTEITGFLGLEQIKYLTEITYKRERNFRIFQRSTQENPDLVMLDFSHMNKISNFAFPLIFKVKEKINLYKKKFSEKMEIRPIIAGNMLNQPFFRDNYRIREECKNSQMVHENGFYIPNREDLSEEEITIIEEMLKGNFN